jgi:TolB protein
MRTDTAPWSRHKRLDARRAERNARCSATARAVHAVRGAAILLVIALAACGGSGSGDGKATPEASTASATSRGASAEPTTTASGQTGSIVFRRWSDPDHAHGVIFTIAPDGRGEKQVTKPPASLSDDFPDFAADGTLIAFQRCGDTDPCHVLTVHPDGAGLRRVDRCHPPRCAETSTPAIAPDDRRVAVSRTFGRFRLDKDSGDAHYEFQGIFTMRMDGSDLRRVTLPRARTARDSQPQWSPDGKQIVFVRENATAQPAGGHAVFVVSAAGGHPRRITPWNLKAGDGPNWSPDGTLILFRSHEDDEFLKSNLYTVHPNGTSLKQITHVAPTTRLYSSAFSPDGASITFGMMGTGGEADVFTMPLDGGAPTPVTRTPRADSAPDWGDDAG